MSMLVRKGTMLHRSSTRRNSRRPSAAGANRRQRSTSLAPAAAVASSATGDRQLPSTSRLSYLDDRRASRATITGSSRSKSPGFTVGRPIALQEVSSTPSLSAPSNDSRRTSEVASQMSSDDRKRLFSEKRRCIDLEKAESTYYGSLTYQLHEANVEATGTCDFLCRALEIIANTVLVSFLLLAFMMLTVFMAIFGVQYLRDCPKEPYVPIYLLVGGCFGGMKVAVLLWRQSRLRRYEDLDDSFSEDDDFSSLASSASTRVTDGALSLFLVVWFAMGNYWVFRIYKPRFEPLLFQPSDWCHGDVYTFSLWQIYVTHSILAGFVLLLLFLIIFRKTATQY